METEVKSNNPAKNESNPNEIPIIPSILTTPFTFLIPLTPTKNLSVLNSHPRDNYIQFYEPTHTYTIKGNSDYLSVTTWIHSFFPKFNADEVIRKMMGSRNWNKDNKYFTMTPDQIKQEWDLNGKEAASLGTKMHSNIENYYNEIPFEEKFIGTPEHNYFMNFFNDHPDHKIYRTEWTVYSEEYKIAGSIDAVFSVPSTSDVIIGDWKRSKEIKYENTYEKGFPPLKHLDNCNFNHYVLQLNIYRHLIETYYDQKVSGMFLVILHPNAKSYQKIIIPRVTIELQMMFSKRKMDLDQ